VTPAWARWRWLVPWLLVFALLAVLYPGPVFEGHVYGSVDAAASAAFREVGDAARAAGDYPFWNPYLFLGMPTFGSLAYNLGVYPPTVVFEFLQNQLGLPPLTWMLGHLLLGGVGMWWLLGRFDVPWSGRLLGCVTWLWFARVVAWGVHGHGSKLGAAMAMPWLLGLAWEVLARGRWRAVGLLSLVLGLQFLRGHVQISYYTLLLLGFLTVWNLIWPLDGSQRPTLAERGRRAGMMAATVALGFSIGAALLLPVHDYAEISTRGQEGASGGGRTPYEYATDWSLGPEDLAATVFAGAAGFGKATYAGRMPFTDYPNYVGLLVLGLAVVAWWSPRRRLVLALAVAALAGLLLAMGRHSPGIYQLAYEILPYFKKFRVPSMAMVVPALLLAVLAAIGARTLAGLGAEASPRLRRAGLVVLIVGAVLLLVGGTGAVASAYRDQLAALAERAGKPTAPVLLDAAWDLHRSLLIRQGLVVMVAGAAVLLAGRRSGFARVGLVPVLAILVAVDLGSVAHLVTQPQDGLVEVVRGADGGGRLAPATRLERPWRPAADSHLPPAQAERLRELVGHDRVLPLGGDANSNAFMIAEIRSLGGYHPAKPAVAEAVRQRLFQGVPSGAVARWLAASVLLTPGPLAPESLDRLATFGLEIAGGGEAIGRRMAYPIADSLPRARLVDRWAPQPASTAGGDALERFLDDVATGRHDPSATVVLAETPDPLPQTGPEPLPEPVFVHDGLDAIEIEAETPRPALLLLADGVAPGWRVRVNGETRPLLVADHVLRAVALPAGRHVVRFEFRDPALARGLILASCGLIVSLTLAVWPRRRRQAAGPDGTGGETTS
jgi:hypothetical protein